MRKTLEIELKSDLCAGTGKGFAAVIDTDTAVDEYGIPFIPGKRIKGCLREIAKEIFELSDEKINTVFGVSGSSTSGTLSISDAKIKDYDSQLDEIKSAIMTGKYKANDITALFCSVRAGTAMENGTVKDNSLRFVRVVNRTSPIDKEPLKFYADIEFNEEDCEIITNLFKALRNIGYHRNRGFGYIKCSLGKADNSLKLESLKFEPDKEYRISYLVYLQGDLMLPATDANHSLDYIPGTSVLGAFAGKFIKKYGENEFNKYFLSSDVKFGNLYISDKYGTDYVPAPGFLAKIKAAGNEAEKGIHNMIANSREDDKKEEKPQYKPLKKGYINLKEGYKEPDTEIIYHNAINTKESIENKGGLYTQYCIGSGQYFKGYIEVKGDKADKIYSLLESGAISFGRSKNSQYSHCVIKEINVEKTEVSEVELKSKNTAAYICESDVVLFKDGRYTVELEDLCAMLGVNTDKLNKFTRLSSRVVSGYNAKWNLKKPQFPVIRAGSCIVFETEEDEKKNEYILVGEKQNEGYGKIRLIPDANSITVNKKSNNTAKTCEYTSELLKEVKNRKAEDEILEKAITDSKKIALNASQVGRITLMCKESDCYEDFEKRIKSIKTVSTKNEAMKHFNEEKLKDTVGDSFEWSACRKYIIAVLTVKKYQLRGENK